METGILVGVVLVVLLVAVVAVRARRKHDITLGNSQPPQPRGSDANDSVESLLGAGNKLAAIKLAREQRGLGLKEAKDYVEALAAGTTTSSIPSSAGTKVDTPFVAAQTALQSGNTIEAIRLVRQATGMGLKEAKDYVEQWRNTGVQPEHNARINLPSLDLEGEARALVAQGNTIAAIKRVRERTGWGLKEAKDYVDSL